MRLNERWLWLGDKISSTDAGLAIFRAYPGTWWLVNADEMIGPFADQSILRAVRIACTPTIDGCECGPAKLGVKDLLPRRPLEKGPRWLPVHEDKLPPSVTRYDLESLKPVSGCRTTFATLPKVRWEAPSGWEFYIEELPKRGGLLTADWNAHPAGSLLFTQELALESGFTIVDIPTAAS